MVPKSSNFIKKKTIEMEANAAAMRKSSAAKDSETKNAGNRRWTEVKHKFFHIKNLLVFIFYWEKLFTHFFPIFSRFYKNSHKKCPNKVKQSEYSKLRKSMDLHYQ